MQEETDQLNELLNHCRDAALGYQTASGRIKDADLQKVLAGYSDRRRDFAYKLEQQIRILGADPAPHANPVAGAHRIWINLKGAISGGQAAAVVEECLRGEKEMIKYYERILNETTFSNDTRLLLAHQLQHIKKDKEELEELVDSKQ